ncbi:uncharacterized protein BDZ83DRAFT_604963 [Colletotrichum acutatum]|uniref:Uncharacterized protein n=1 Tax=Glomerella acutata TaxID=27357 RepID=A0AAD9D0B6_GLOAC|nr:uncharacterized protein BDZ83DRAFT_604963 [Colletotrichum acutatum]KAK1729787.1 hypothetical protein BDZ83DRAFT_604963 [Colletotrichum acutatum]
MIQPAVKRTSNIRIMFPTTSSTLRCASVFSGSFPCKAANQLNGPTVAFPLDQKEK